MKSLLQEIKDLNGWDYYDNRNEEDKCKILNWNDITEHQTFIKKFLKIGGKESIVEHFFPNDLRDVGISLENFERATHTNSVFFLGCLLYEKLALKNKINFVRADGKDDEFHFIWFLTSLVHDFGYFAEKCKSIFPHITEDLSSLLVTHNLLSCKEADQQIVEGIKNYFKESFKGSIRKPKIEHGIYAGLVLYDGLVKNRLERKRQQENGAEEKSLEGLYWGDDLDKFYAIASFAIARHNMWLKDLMFSIDTEPYLFLFGLVDTIEPIKTFDCVSIEYVLKNILIEGNQDEIILQNAPDSKLCFSKLIDKISGLKDWINVNVVSEENKVTIKINH